MRLVVTGGGTGGHIYPALEVAREAMEAGDELLYLGSLRGQEGAACQKIGMMFHGFPSEPLYSLATLRGLKAATKLVQATGLARVFLNASRPDIVFSTGGYSSAPITLAAGSLGIPYALHACDTVPGRALKMVAGKARVMTCSFKNTAGNIDREVIRTGHPIRKELREGLRFRTPRARFVLGLGGSQGSVFLNTVISKAAAGMSDVEFLLSTGQMNIDLVQAETDHLGERFTAKGYLNAQMISEAYRTSSLAIARSGGTIAEFALARLPSILIPLPGSADNHQHENAMEFVEMGAATILPQPSSESAFGSTAASLQTQIRDWINDTDRRDRAERALAEWDIPDASAKIYQELKKIGLKK